MGPREAGDFLLVFRDENEVLFQSEGLFQPLLPSFLRETIGIT
jgi:hypothetical protein